MSSFNSRPDVTPEDIHRILSNEGLADLLAEFATSGLSTADEQRLAHEAESEKYAAVHAASESLQFVAARIACAELNDVRAIDEGAPVLPVPADLATRIEAAVSERVRSSFDSRSPSDEPVDSPAMTPTRPMTDAASIRRSSRPDRSHESSRGPVLARIAPWFVTAAACVLALIAWRQIDQNGSNEGPFNPSTFLAEHSDAREFNFADALAADSGTEVRGGTIAWSQEAQAGFMVLRGFAANTPSELQYQLWIFDAKRAARGEPFNAVDGGVFDISAATRDENGDYVIPFTARLPVLSASQFAITSEPPGGVVKHNPETGSEAVSNSRRRIRGLNSVDPSQRCDGPASRQPARLRFRLTLQEFRRCR